MRTEFAAAFLLTALGAPPSGSTLDTIEGIAAIIAIIAGILGFVRFRALNAAQREELETKIRQDALNDIDVAMKMLRREMATYVDRIDRLEEQLQAANERIAKLE